MNKTLYTGNDFLDKLTRGPYVNNPNYNPKTKAGRSQPRVLVDTNSGNIHGGAYSTTVDKLKNIQFTGKDLGFTNEEIENINEEGITINPYITQE